MNYTEQIFSLKRTLGELSEKRTKFRRKLRRLKVGDMLIGIKSHFWYNEYYPQIIKQIDIDNCKVLVYDELDKTEKWMNSFYVYDGKLKTIRPCC